MMSMVKEFRTAEELSDMIVSKLAVKDVAIQVRKDHAFGCSRSLLRLPEI
jgi:hypothetical protein